MASKSWKNQVGRKINSSIQQKSKWTKCAKEIKAVKCVKGGKGVGKGTGGVHRGWEGPKSWKKSRTLTCTPVPNGVGGSFLFVESISVLIIRVLSVYSRFTYREHHAQSRCVHRHTLHHNSPTKPIEAHFSPCIGSNLGFDYKNKLIQACMDARKHLTICISIH